MAKTTAEIAQTLGVDKTATNGFVTVLKSLGVLVQAGTIKPEGRKIGKGAATYDVTSDGEQKLTEILTQLKG